jgi:hypothetical protein
MSHHPIQPAVRVEIMACLADIEIAHNVRALTRLENAAPSKSEPTDAALLYRLFSDTVAGSSLRAAA